MHDSTRRILCRLAFFALCLAPSGSLCAWIVYRATPICAWQEQTFWTESIYQTTGLIAEVGRIRHPTQARTLLEDVSLSDPDGGALIARVRVVEFATTDHGIVTIASQPEVHAHQLRRLSQILYDRVLRGPRPLQQFQLVSGEVTLHETAGASTASDVRCLVTSDRNKIEATIDFLLAGYEMHAPAQIRLTREHVDGAASTSWQIRTGGVPLPCSMVSDYIPALRSLGKNCHFQGTVWIQEDDRSWDGEIAGQFRGVDLERLVDPFPHKLSGTAELALSHTNFRQGRLVEAAGALNADGGVISQSLLTAAAEALKLGSNVGSNEQADTLLAYRQLAFGFQIDDAGLKLSGLCDERQEGVLLVGTSGNLLLDSQSDVIPSIALARALVPQTELLVPATTATEQLLRALPLPTPTLPSARTARTPYSPLRYSGERQH
ncbi:MAG: hypothetical protein H6822_32620 [Planctomycetaceae bacterium]|nr:hypothetical protein [Planctomycetales bacterium]MCB9926931.1 hypothetical protein [Planctomycetaceae bacterium]